MADTEDRALEVQTKKELKTDEETTIPARYYVPLTDIYETADTLTVVMEMAGVNKDGVEISVDEDALEVEGHIDLSNYAEMEPVYSEYNVGHYRRKFTLSSKIDRERISAEMKDGVLTLLLPKTEEVKPRRIEIS